MDINECVRKGFLAKEEPAIDLIEKELKESAYDMASAQRALEEKDYKWCIVKCYYAMFHAGKAVCFRNGYREKKHIAVLIMLEHLNKEGKMEGRFVNDFSAAMAAREGADYRYAYSQERAEQMVKMAKGFKERMDSSINAAKKG